MRGLVERELAAIALTPGVLAAAVAHAAVLLAFLLTWSGGIPGLTGTLLEQQRQLDVIVLLVVLPWTALRVAIPERAGALALVSAMAACRPSSVLVARALALVAVLALVCAAGVPVLLVGAQMSAQPALLVLTAAPLLLGLCVLVACISVAALAAAPSRLLSWGLAAVVSGAALITLRWWFAGPREIAATLIAGAIVISVAARYADTGCRYVER